MKKLIITLAIILIGISSTHSQNSYQSIKLNLTAPYKKTFTFSILLGVTADPVAMDYLQFDAGYLILKNSELGISVGKEDSPSGYDFVMIGGYFTQHFGQGIHTGLRVGLPGEYSPSDINTYNEFYLGDDFPITDKFNLRIRISYSYLSKVILGLNGDFKDKRIGFQAGFNYLF